MAKVSGSMEFVKEVHGVRECRIPNGLRVLHREDRSAPVVCVMITYHVGSRNEAAGCTGATHILEHLLFKDSKNFNAKNGKGITGHLEWLGANVNASTWFDRTHYYQLLPKEHASEAIALEADRMRGSLFNDADLASEMTVVRNEYERGRNNPFELIDEMMWAQAFIAHPYHYTTIGLKEDIEHSTAATLREFYDTFYWPNNATLIVIGDISNKELEPLVARAFAVLPASPHPIPQMHIKEPKQEGRREFELRSPLGIEIAALGYKIPEGRHADYPALLMLSRIMAGGLSSRLERKLVDKGLAVALNPFITALHDPSLFYIAAQTAPNVDPRKLTDSMRREFASVAKAGVSVREVSRAREQLLAEFAYVRDGVMGESWMLNEALAAGDWTLGYAISERIRRVTPHDIKKVARAYMTDAAETVGILRKKI